MHTGNRNFQIFDQIARRLTKLKPNEIFNDFSISQDQINEIKPGFLNFEDMDYKTTLGPTGSDRTNLGEVGAE